MTLLDTQRSRRTVLWAALISTAIFGFLFARQMASAHAARQAVIPQQMHVAEQRNAEAGLTSHRTPVLVELFTSEGCSSCPPADDLLAHLQQKQPVAGAEIIALEEHVDYWDQLGWHDRFSAHQFTERQSAYEQRFHLDDDYTPQMVVDGSDQFVGNDSARALHAIAKSAEKPKIALVLAPPVADGGSISGSVSVGAGTTLPKADLYAALIEPTASTEVHGGENGGRTLHHLSVVRGLQRIGTLDRLARGALSFSLNVPKDSTAGSLQVVVFAQREGQGEVLAIAASATAQLARPSGTQQLSMR